MIKFSSYWKQCQFFLGTPNNPSLFLAGMAEKIKTVILYRQILSSKRTVHRQRLKGEIHRHVETTHEIRGKAQKEKWLFAAIAQVVIQTGMDSSAHNSSSVSVTTQDHAIPRFFFGELCCELFALAEAIFVKGTHAPRLQAQQN